MNYPEVAGNELIAGEKEEKGISSEKGTGIEILDRR